MKLNFKHAIMAVAACFLGLTSCSNNDEITTDVDNGEETHMKVSFTFPASERNKVRATGDDYGTDAEAAIKSVDVFIFTSGGAYVSRNTLSASDFTQSTSTTEADVYEATTKIKTTTGAKSVLVGVNLPSTVASSMEHKAISDILNTSQSLTRAQMTNLTNGLPMFSTAVVTSTFVTDETNPANNITVTVKRMVAKVTVEKSPSMIVAGVSGELGTLEFAINNFNEKSYLIQNAAPDYKDPNWASGSYLASDFSDAGDSNWKTIVTTVSDPKTLVANYAAENTSEDTKMGEITRATIRATFMPDVITVYMNGTDDTDGFTTESRTNLSISSPQTFYTVTSSVLATTAFFYTEAIADDYVTNNGGTKITFTDGYSYWSMFLNKGTTNKGKQWDVLRNEYFRCQITRIVAPGNSTPDVKDPDDVPNEETNISTDINILFWNTPVLADYDLIP